MDLWSDANALSGFYLLGSQRLSARVVSVNRFGPEDDVQIGAFVAPPHVLVRSGRSPVEEECTRLRLANEQLTREVGSLRSLVAKVSVPPTRLILLILR